eukprot:588483-Rhodomonas_salina.1
MTRTPAVASYVKLEDRRKTKASALGKFQAPFPLRPDVSKAKFQHKSHLGVPVTSVETVISRNLVLSFG